MSSATFAASFFPKLFCCWFYLLIAWPGWLFERTVVRRRRRRFGCSFEFGLVWISAETTITLVYWLWTVNVYVTTWSAAAREKIKINERKHFNKKKFYTTKQKKRESNEYNNIIFKLLQIIFLIWNASWNLQMHMDLILKIITKIL